MQQCDTGVLLLTASAVHGQTIHLMIVHKKQPAGTEAALPLRQAKQAVEEAPHGWSLAGVNPCD